MTNKSKYTIHWDNGAPNGVGHAKAYVEGFQAAIDVWADVRNADRRAWIEVDAHGEHRTLTNEKLIQEWAEWLMKNGYNRIEKRIMTEMMEDQQPNGMEVVDVKEDVRFRDEIPELMGKVFHSKGLEDFKNIQGTREATSTMQDAINALSTEEEETDFHGDFGGMSLEMQDAIINPKHYKMIPPEAYEEHPEGLEYMDLMEYILEHHKGVQGHLLGQIFKYACRLGRKDNMEQDATKIEWYANRLVKVIQNAKTI